MATKSSVQKFILQTSYPAVAHGMANEFRVKFMSSNIVCKFVQNCMKKCNHQMSYSMVCSTEEGVHCINNWIMIENWNENVSYLPSFLSYLISKRLHLNSDIRVRNCKIVPIKFDAKNCIESREFLYKICQLKNCSYNTQHIDARNILESNYNFLKQFPVDEVGKSYLLINNLPLITDAEIENITKASKNAQKDGLIDDFSIKKLNMEHMEALNSSYNHINVYEMYLKTRIDSLDTKEVRRIFSQIFWEGMTMKMRERGASPLQVNGSEGSIGSDWEFTGNMFLLPVEGLYLINVIIKKEALEWSPEDVKIAGSSISVFKRLISWWKQKMLSTC